MKFKSISILVYLFVCLFCTGITGAQAPDCLNKCDLDYNTCLDNGTPEADCDAELDHCQAVCTGVPVTGNLWVLLAAGALLGTIGVVRSKLQSMELLGKQS